MILNRSKLTELGACKESLAWIGDGEYPYTPDGVRAALDADVESDWLEWLFRKTRCVDAEMWRLADIRVITEDAEVTSGFAVCVSGSPTITVSGGEVAVYGVASPTITVNGGAVAVYGDAEPTITVSAGWVSVFDAAKPTITVSGGEVVVCDNAEPVVRRENGTEIEAVVDAYGRRIYRV